MGVRREAERAFGEVWGSGRRFDRGRSEGIAGVNGCHGALLPFALAVLWCAWLIEMGLRGDLGKA
jgi:hypothetical protein